MMYIKDDIKNDIIMEAGCMALKKKYVVQKTFRLDQSLEHDLFLLAELTNRTQNELANNAIESYIQENKNWFATNMIVEHFSPIFECTGEDYSDIFQMQGLTVQVIWGSTFIIKIKVTQNGKIVEEYEREYSDEEELKEYLRYLTTFLDFEKEDVQQYLSERLDYSENLRK